jgi:hypothetical protein
MWDETYPGSSPVAEDVPQISAQSNGHYGFSRPGTTITLEHGVMNLQSIGFGSVIFERYATI